MLHFRAALLLTNFSSALGISIRHAGIFLLHFFFSQTNKFSVENIKEDLSPLPPSYCFQNSDHAVQSCSTTTTVFFHVQQNRCQGVFSHLPRSPPKRRILSRQLISAILLYPSPRVWKWALASPAQNARKLLLSTSAVATLQGGTWASVLSRSVQKAYSFWRDCLGFLACTA